eukprot:CAMPEP_0117077494 /NCGR_PEP_ID=MMETSP0472-20121206/54648_1 /TAXON_ID=693140 ORGANISM="Tiarina fusus, Strain LIS" /NCGR_SAMPLE_ID=MMETSP0472 /ASSEMBLY_ACC=CAM_ASM_000603 /LENGTH=68 /DNA_ID=CAMNT_0004803867 /DNA_START=239 /DNA_END=445 /DNA_ORIENTATION=+
MDDIHDKYADQVDFYVLDVDAPNSQPILEQMQISSIPDVRLFHNGNHTDGFVQDSLKEFFANAAKLAK